MGNAQEGNIFSWILMSETQRSLAWINTYSHVFYDNPALGLDGRFEANEQKPVMRKNDDTGLSPKLTALGQENHKWSNSPNILHAFIFS